MCKKVRQWWFDRNCMWDFQGTYCRYSGRSMGSGNTTYVHGKYERACVPEFFFCFWFFCFFKWRLYFFGLHQVSLINYSTSYIYFLFNYIFSDYFCTFYFHFLLSFLIFYVSLIFIFYFFCISYLSLFIFHFPH